LSFIGSLVVDPDLQTIVRNALNAALTPGIPAFDALSSPEITYGTASTMISGHLQASPGMPLVPAGEVVQVTVNGVTQAATLGASDDFSTTFDTSNLTVASYTVSFSYIGDRNFATATSTSTLTITPAPSLSVVITAQLATKKVGKKQQLVIQVFENGTEKNEFTSPFQKPRFKNIQVSVRGNQVVLTAKKGKKGKRAVTATFPG
jgi:hypothetical protein